MLKKLFRLSSLIAVIVAIVWLTREHLLPTPRVPADPRPHYRSTPPPPTGPDDLTEVSGIGPVYEQRLHAMGIKTFRGLAETDPQTVADAVGTSPAAVGDWIAQAQTKLS